MLNLDELKYDKNNQSYDDGYRIVYFYEDGSHSVGEYCKTIEGFMVGFTEFDPIITEDDIPEFISNEDLLEKCLKYDKNAISAAIYKTNGTLITKLHKKIDKKI